jgi:hypothetical protein
MHRRGAGAHQKKTLQHIGNAPRTVFRMIRFDFKGLVPNLIGKPRLTA